MLLMGGISVTCVPVAAPAGAAPTDGICPAPGAWRWPPDDSCGQGCFEHWPQLYVGTLKFNFKKLSFLILTLIPPPTLK